MAEPYNHRAIEQKWRDQMGSKPNQRKRWKETKILLS